MYYQDKESYINAIQKLSAKKIYIVGAGKFGKLLGMFLDKKGIQWSGYIDRRLDLLQINGKPVYSYEAIEDAYYIVSSYTYGKELEDELKKHNIKQNQIVMFEKYEIINDIYKDLIDWEYYTNKVKKFYNKFDGERCFVIGNGPSLQIRDLEKMKQEYTFASNSIYALYGHTDWRPYFYCASDSIFCKEMMGDRENAKILVNGCKFMFTTIMGEGIQYRDDEDMKSLHYFCHVKAKTPYGYPCFSDDCSKQVYGSATVAYDMLQLAAYMGFKKIYLLGMDLNFSVEKHENNTIIRKDVMNHMPEIEEEEAKRFYQAILERHNEKYVADVPEQLASYQSAKAYADAHGIQIYNATRGGKLEVFPRVDFDSLFD